MEQHNIQFRGIRKSDYEELEKLICETWNFDRLCSPKVAKQMSKLTLANCLTNQTYVCVAENNGEAVGVVMGKDEKAHRIPMRYVFHQLCALVPVLLTKEGRGISKFFNGLDKSCEDMLKNSGRSFGGELAFFAVRSDQRGTGIGNKLYHRFHEYMKTRKIESFFLYTDSTCNFGFYDHQGMKRIIEEKFSFKPYLDEEMVVYIYGHDEK